jgi:hypothetical protein
MHIEIGSKRSSFLFRFRSLGVAVFTAGGCWYHRVNEADDHRVGHE